jgi:hypothetical protein
MDGLRKQSFTSASLTEQHDWDVGPRGERCQLETTRHGVIARSEVFKP